MRLFTFIKRLFHRRKSKSDLASLCVLFGVSKEQLLDEYTPLTAEGRNIASLENFKNMIKEKR